MTAGQVFLLAEIGTTIAVIGYRYYLGEKWTWRLYLSFLWWLDILFFLYDLLLRVLVRILGRGEPLMPLPRRDGQTTKHSCPDCGKHELVPLLEIEERARAVTRGEPASPEDVQLLAKVTLYFLHEKKKKEFASP